MPKTVIASLLCYLRNLALKRSRAFTCCASCKDLPAPVGNRLCVSMKPCWKADAVLLGDWNAVKLAAAVASLRAAMPWLRHIHIPTGIEMPGQSVFALPEGIEEAELHNVSSLAEHFFVFRPDGLPAAPLLREDFFTPNGMPLFFAASGGSADAPNFLPGPAGRTKSLSALFAGACDADPALADQCSGVGYTLAFARWAYAERHGLLAPSPFSA